MKSNVWISITFIFCIITWSCERKPKACLDMPDTIEAGATVRFESCSEDFEFLTWEFNDGRGYLDQVVERSFDKEGKFMVRLTAHSDGAFRTDVIAKEFKTSFRFIDRFEITGDSPYEYFIMRVKEDFDANDLENSAEWMQIGAEGSFTDAAPFIMNVYPESSYRIRPITRSFQLYGLLNGRNTLLAEQSFNFDRIKDNPVTFQSENGNYTVRMFWTYR